MDGKHIAVPTQPFASVEVVVSGVGDTLDTYIRSFPFNIDAAQIYKQLNMAIHYNTGPMDTLGAGEFAANILGR